MNVSTRRAIRVLPGLSLLVGLGLLARGVSFVTPVNHLVVAVALGVLIVNAVGVPTVAEDGVGIHKLLLEAGIVVMGARIALGQLLAVGPELLALVVLVVAFTIVYVETLARWFFDVAEEMGSLIASGAGVCGTSAVVAVAGGIDADEEQIAYAVGTILLFDAITLIAYPVVGTLLELPDRVYGIWAGLSMFSTGPVTAAGFAYSEAAGQWATITKLTRNVFIGVLAVAYATYYARQGEASDPGRNTLQYLWSEFPGFIVGFVLLMVIASAGLLSDDQIVSMKHAYQWLFTFAFVGLGLNIRADEMRDAGYRPALVVLIALVTVSTFTLGIVNVIFG